MSATSSYLSRRFWGILSICGRPRTRMFIREGFREEACRRQARKPRCVKLNFRSLDSPPQSRTHIRGSLVLTFPPFSSLLLSHPRPHILVADERREYGRLIWNYRSLWNYGTFRLSSFSSFSSSSSSARQSNFAAFVEIPRDDRSAALSALLTPSRPFFPPAFHFAILRNWVARGYIANNEVTKAKTM